MLFIWTLLVKPVWDFFGHYCPGMWMNNACLGCFIYPLLLYVTGLSDLVYVTKSCSLGSRLDKMYSIVSNCVCLCTSYTKGELDIAYITSRIIGEDWNMCKHLFHKPRPSLSFLSFCFCLPCQWAWDHSGADHSVPMWSHLYRFICTTNSSNSHFRPGC